jgi:hypothetical protein
VDFSMTAKLAVLESRVQIEESGFLKKAALDT